MWVKFWNYTGSLLCGPLHGYQEEHYLRSTYPCGPKSSSQTTSEINVQNDTTLKGGIANLQRSHRLPLVFNKFHNFPPPMSVPYMSSIAGVQAGSYLYMITIVIDVYNQFDTWVCLKWGMPKHNSCTLKGKLMIHHDILDCLIFRQTHTLPKIFLMAEPPV